MADAPHIVAEVEASAASQVRASHKELAVRYLRHPAAHRARIDRAAGDRAAGGRAAGRASRARAEGAGASHGGRRRGLNLRDGAHQLRAKLGANQRAALKAELLEVIEPGQHLQIRCMDLVAPAQIYDLEVGEGADRGHVAVDAITVVEVDVFELAKLTQRGKVARDTPAEEEVELFEVDQGSERAEVARHVRGSEEIQLDEGRQPLQVTQAARQPGQRRHVGWYFNG
mmetsp:Transcript_101295/g.290634  ORF Transcript_101295/g.290634 Transcript_101295/m.290634 type:complete len:228 (-) Transcript_101295:98-781(-)